MVIVFVFVNNLPPQIPFMKYGDAVDAFIPRKRSSKEGNFGYVRFKSISEAKRVILRLNATWIFGHCLGVNMARFGGRSSHWRRSPEKSVAEDAKQRGFYGADWLQGNLVLLGYWDVNVMKWKEGLSSLNLRIKRNLRITGAGQMNGYHSTVVIRVEREFQAS
ncbi:hypothetical protein J1N35_023192 [Gossypium stocksii]|uniref:RRM domain-containing protein n=1 Tax=Gossypium stocksii TaxID=47602 RepID=A0A9D3VIK0_9ROSI|nr:hypothetical protein J1N35_023192 [Gossypium stocksii]